MARRELHGCRAILTGASSGIGRALTIELVSAGVRVLAVARRAERLDTLARELASGPGEILVQASDVTDDVARRAVVEAAQERFGGLDLLVNNAGIGAMGRFAEASPERLRQVMEVNFFAPAELIRMALPLLHVGRKPLVVNVGSILGQVGIPFCAEYCASKFAIRGLSQSLRAELAPLGVDILLVSPGTTETEFFERAIDARKLPWSDGRAMTPADVARQVVRAIRAGRSEIVLGSQAKLLTWAQRLVPGVVRRVLAKYGRSGPN
ncbi:MAG TPA: SDR family NAD(P)-dependent oxidoreductase [Pirellulales bacterium]